MKLLIAAVAMTLTACAAPQQNYRNNIGQAPSGQLLAECDYEATKATAGIINGFEAGWMQGTIMRKCLSIKGYVQR